MEELKSWLNQILWDQNLSVDEKYNQVINRIPNYLTNTEEKKAVYEKIEWIFHDWLWTYFELIIYDKVNTQFNLNQEEADKSEAKRKMKLWIDLYKKFFRNNEYEVNLENEIHNIENAGNLALDLILEYVWTSNVQSVKSSSQDFREWNARDVYIELSNWENLNFSVKTDKSWKMAVYEWQTSLIQEKVYNRYFKLTDNEFNNLLDETFPWKTLTEIKSDYSNIALITQKVLIKQLWLEDAQINNLLHARITNIDNLKYFLTQLKYYKRSKDGSVIIAGNRLNWELIDDYVIDQIDIDNLDVSKFSFTKTSWKSSRYWTTPCLKYLIWGRKQDIVSLQIKHERWEHSSKRFCDITIRLHELK